MSQEPTTIKYFICELCRSYLANGDLTPVDYYYHGETADNKANEIINGIDQIVESRRKDLETLSVAMFATSNEVEPHRDCDGCGSEGFKRFEADLIYFKKDRLPQV